MNDTPITAEAIVTLDPRPPNPRQVPIHNGYIANLRAADTITGASVTFRDVASLDAGESAVAELYFPSPQNAGVPVEDGAEYEVLDAVVRIGIARIVRVLAVDQPP